MLYDVIVAIAVDKSLKFVNWKINPDDDSDQISDDDCSDGAIEDAIEYLENDCDYYVENRAPGLYKARLDIGCEETDFEIIEPLYLC